MPRVAEGEASAKDVLEAFARGAESAGDLSELAILSQMIMVAVANGSEDVGSYLKVPLPAFKQGEIERLTNALCQEIHGTPVYAIAMFITGSTPEYHEYMEERMSHVNDIEEALEATKEMANIEETLRKMGSASLQPCIMTYVACSSKDFAAGMVVLNDDKEFESYRQIKLGDILSKRVSFGASASPDRLILSALIRSIDAAKAMGKSIDKLMGET